MNTTIPTHATACGLLLLSLAPGCPTDSEGPSAASASTGSSASAGTGAAPTAAALISAVCTRQTQCCAGNEDEAACAESLGLVLSVLFASPNIAIDGPAVTACIEFVESADCELVASYGGTVPVLGACEPFSQGTQTLGGACGGDDLIALVLADDECATGVCSDGICVAFAAVGEACEGSGCELGSQCFQGTCLAEHAEGEDCSADGLCLAPLSCFGDPMTCQSPELIMLGEVCGPDKLCELGAQQCWCPVDDLGCSESLCGNSSRCLPS